MSRKNCVYCNKEITTRSREHVIQNALGAYTNAKFNKLNNYLVAQTQKFK